MASCRGFRNYTNCMTEITTLIFDWHGVLDMVTFESLTKKLAAIKHLEIKNIKSVIHEDERLYAAGKIPSALFWEKVQHHFLLTPDDLSSLEDYILSCKLNVDLWKYLDSLTTTYTLAILSDCPKDKLNTIQKTANLGLFKATHFSCEKGILKNNDDFFLNLVEELQVKPLNCLYIDDSQKHIITAKPLGFQTCLFTTTADLKKLLE